MSSSQSKRITRQFNKSTRRYFEPYRTQTGSEKVQENSQICAHKYNTRSKNDARIKRKSLTKLASALHIRKKCRRSAEVAQGGVFLAEDHEMEEVAQEVELGAEDYGMDEVPPVEEAEGVAPVNAPFDLVGQEVQEEMPNAVPIQVQRVLQPEVSEAVQALGPVVSEVAQALGPVVSEVAQALGPVVSEVARVRVSASQEDFTLLAPSNAVQIAPSHALQMAPSQTLWDWRVPLSALLVDMLREFFYW